MLGQDAGTITDGWALPALWHWVYLLERPAQAELGPDGHARHGIPAPPRPGLQRMFGGGRVTVEHPLRLGTVASADIEVADTRTRRARSGELTIVTTRTTVVQQGRRCIVDEQDILYRQPGDLAATDAEPVEDGQRRWSDITVDEVLLFRFSALTYNGHRIHYDAGYCRDQGYAGLVVHGPLQALLMAEAARRSRPDGRRFEYRLTAPLTLGQGLRIGTEAAGAAVVTAACDATGRRTASGRLT